MIKVIIEKTVILSEWCDKEAWDDVFKNDQPAFIEFLEEDCMSFLEECGGLAGIIKSAEWID